MKKLLISATISSILLATGCTEQSSTMNTTATTQTDSSKAEQTNPLFMTSSLTYGAPQFDLIKDEQFIPAFEKGREQHLKEVEKIIEQEKLEKQAKQKPIEEKITIALIEYFQAANNRKQQLKAISDLNNMKASMIEGLKIENKKLKEIVSVLEKQVKELKKDNKILAEDNARRK